MWPSMKSGHKGSATGEFDNKSRQSRDCILEELLSHDHAAMPSFASHSESEDEDDFTEQILRSEERKDKDSSDTYKFNKCGVLKVSTEDFTGNTLSWLTTNSGQAGLSVFSPIDNLSLSPLDMTPFGIKDRQVAELTDKFSIGFEDDFTVFVSAPAVNDNEGDVGYHKQQNSFESPISVSPGGTLEPQRACVRYHSLGSVSDFGGSDFGHDESLNDDGDNEVDHKDDDLPTKEEIRKASAQIFGKSTKGVPATESGPVPEDTEPSFDLSQVMSVMQQFKTDIAGMDNEEERRRAAATVALGLLYGLEV